MNNKTEIAFSNHIKRLEKDITETPDGPNANINRRNIASLREHRIPQYNDHLDCLLGNDSMDMREFSDLTELVRDPVTA